MRFSCAYSCVVHLRYFMASAPIAKPASSKFDENYPMTKIDGFDKQPESLSLSRVYRLIELERIEMEKRVAENRKLNCNYGEAA